MLRSLRKASSNWIGKSVMAAVVGFLIISFGIWGIGDIFRGFSVNTVAKVGHSEISVDQFRIRYTDELQQLGRQLGRPVTPDEARAFGLEQQLLAQMIASAALDERAQQLGLGISDAEVIKRITSDPAFQGINGQFDPNLFQQRIRDLGFTEQRFVYDQRQGTMRRQIAEAIAADISPPKTTSEIIDHFRNEERSVEYIVLDASKAGEIPQPTPEQLSKYFDDHKFAFRAPEYRKVVLLPISQAEIARTIEVSDEDAMRVFMERQNRYATPERRDVQQIVFPNAEEAKKASERLAEGLSFEDLAKERNLTGKDIDLGLVTKADILDPAVANAAFGLAEGAISAPVAGRFGTAILRVVKIEPASTKTFAEVELEIKHDIALDRAKAEVNEIRDKVDEELGGGTGLEEIAQKLHLPFRTIDAVDRTGNAPDGKMVADLPPGANLVSAAFATEIGSDNDPLMVTGGGFVWYDVLAITPARDRTLEEAKQQVEERWRQEETVKRLDAKTAEIMDKLKSGTSIADIAMADQTMVETKSGLKRETTDALPARAVAQVFRTAKDGFGSSEGQNPTDRIIFRVTDIKVPTYDANSSVVQGINNDLKNAYNQNLIGQYVSRVETDLGISVNELALSQAVGRASSNQ